MRVKRSLWKVAGGSLAILVLLAGFAAAAFGQSATGTLTGTVTDPKGLAMTGVNVAVHNVDTGVDHSPVMTNDQGIYLVPLLQPGNYDITVSQTGFSTVKHAAVSVQVGQTLRIDVEMPVSAQQTLVTVTTEAPLLETEKTDQSQNVNENLVSNLPVSSRRWEQFALLTPGLSPDGTAGGFSFHGINSLYNTNSVDGANNNYSYDGTSRGAPANDGYTYSGDSVREFQVSSTGFGAEIGESAGGSVNAVTKSGTNQLHGDLFYNGRSAGFNAIDPVNAANALAIPGGVATQNVHQQHQYGFSVGGPILKDKLFFFATMDGYRKIFPLTVATNQLSPPIQQLTCPTILPGSPAGATAPTAVQCQAAKDYIFAHYIGTFPRALRQDIELVKLDYQLSQANHISGVANIRDWHTTADPQLFSGATPSYVQDRFVIANWTTVIGSNKVNELRYQWGVDNPFQGVNNAGGLSSVNVTNLFNYGSGGGSPGFTKETRNQISDNFSWTRGTHAIKFGLDLNIIEENARGANTAGGNYMYSSVDTIPNVSCTAPTQPGGAAATSATQTANGLFCDWLVDVYGSNTQGTAICGATPTYPLPAGCQLGQHFSTFTQLHDVLASGPPNTFLFLFPNNDYAGYIQDVWKLRPNLTITAGLRYDLQVIAKLPSSVAEVLPLLPAGSRDLPIFDKYLTVYPNEYDGLQPRVGAAWNITKNSVFRFGGGLFFAKTDGHNVKGVIMGAAESTNPCVTLATGGDGSCTGPLSFPNVYYDQVEVPLTNTTLPGAATAIVQAPASGGVPLPNPNVGLHAVDPDLKRPKVYTLNMSYERQLPGNMSLSVSYAFARGLHLPRGRDFNIGPNLLYPSFCTTAATTFGSSAGQTCPGFQISKSYDVVNSTGVTQTAVTVPFYSSMPAVTGNGSTVAAAPGFSSRTDPLTGLLNGNSATVSTRYSGLIVSLRKPMSHGLEVVGNYTLGQAKDNGQQGGSNGTAGQVGITSLDPYNNTAEYGNSGTDVRHRFTASVVYSPTFGKNVSNKVEKQFVDGWNISSSFIAQSGSHYTAMIQGSTAKNEVINGFTPGSTAQTTFTFTPLDGSMGGAGVNSPGSNLAGRAAWLPIGGFVLPNLYNVDLRLTKEFAVKERYRIEVRGEAFNVFNTTLVQAVSQNAFSYASPSGTSTTCPNSVSAGNGGNLTPHTNTCMVPVQTFGQPTTTTGNNLGARQMQAGVRFEF